MRPGKIFQFSAAVFFAFFVVFLLSPWISLFLSAKLTDHVYAEITYQVIADNETCGLVDKEAQAVALFNYVRRNIFLPIDSTPYKGKPLDYLISGIGWCDYMSKALNCLLAKKGIPSRYAMLLDKEGVISIHTLNEIFIDGKWTVFDSLMGVIFKDDDRGYLRLEEIPDKPYLNLKNARLLALQQLNGDDYYSGMFAITHAPRRSESRLADLNVFDHLASSYAHILGRSFSNSFQDIYLKTKSRNFEDDFRLYYFARNYHLHYRFDLAKEYYEKLIDDYPNSPHSQDSLFFLGVLYINVMGDCREGIKRLESLVSVYPGTKWLRCAYLYLGLAHDKMGDAKEAEGDYQKADLIKLDDDMLKRIRRNKS